MSSSRNQLEKDVRKLTMDYKVEMPINDKMDSFIVDFHGPKNSLYEGGLWKVRVLIPDGYPYEPPMIFFENKIYHPNVEEECGLVCLNFLGQAWNPEFDLLNVFKQFLPYLLLDPNPEDPFNHEAAALMRTDLPGYEQRVKEYCEKYCEKYAKPEDEAKSHSSDETVVAELSRVSLQ